MDKHTWDVLSEIIDSSGVEREELLKEIKENNSELYTEITEILDKYDEADEWWSKSTILNGALLSEFSDFLLRDFPEEDSLTGKKVGPYKIEKLIGTGGMGNVYSASRTDGEFERTVAIKVMSFGLAYKEIRKRFNTEKKILGSLNHPGIGQLYDAGVSEDGHAYLVLELVDGKELIEYVKQENLSLEAKFDLFLGICEAVDFAHKNLIIHRDLKPQNILVSEEGKPKILDFGISKIFDETSNDFESTLKHHKVYSLKYASPEQVQGETLTTATDVYTLGIILFMIMTNGNELYSFSDLNRKEAEEAIVSGKLSDAAFLNNFMPADLCSIISKSLRVEPNERYDSVRSLMDDVGRYSKNEVVLAVQGGLAYRAKKFWRRHRAIVAGSIITISTLVAFSAYHFIQIDKERIIAEREATKAEQTKDYLLSLFDSANPLNNDGEVPTAYDLLDQGIIKLADVDGEPELKEDASFTLANVAFRLGKYEVADSLFQVSFLENQKHQIIPNLQQTEILDWLSDVQKIVSDHKLGFEYADSSLVLKMQLLPENDIEIVDSYYEIAQHLAHLGRVDTALSLIEKAEALTLDGEELDTLKRAYYYQETADIFRESDDFEKSTVLTKEAIRLFEALDETQKIKSDLASAYNNLGFTYRNLEEYVQAEVAYRNSLNMLNDIYDRTHPYILTTMGNLASVLTLGEKFYQAEEILLQRVQLTTEAYGENHWRTGSVHSGLGGFYMQTKQFKKSMEAYKKSEQVYTQALGDEHFWTRREHLRKAKVLAVIGDKKEAELIFKQNLSEIKIGITQKLTYYNYQSLVKIRDENQELGLESLANQVTELIIWHDENYGYFETD